MSINIKQAYNSWSEVYDSNANKTRDLEAKVLRETLKGIHFQSCLEIGCGTGKNTFWLMKKAKQITAVDFSEKMLAKAKEKISSKKVNFIEADITKNWFFTKQKFDLVTFSLVLEHIQHLEPIFAKVAKALNSGGYLYVGELHPFKQYSGSKARFDSENGLQIVTCFTHHLSDFIQAAKKNSLALLEVNEYFDAEHADIPRILFLLFKKI